jgi:hypothetical protein
VSFEISNTRIRSDAVLKELVLQSLDKIIGPSYRLLGRDLPFNIDHALLALDGNGQPSLIVVDQQDGGQALLKGLKLLEAMEKHRACVFKLYPDLFGNRQHALRSDDIHLYLMAPSAPPGGDCLRRIFTRLHIRTIQTLLINGEPALLIGDPEPNAPPIQEQEAPDARFRSDSSTLTAEENAYFDNQPAPG